MPNSKPIADLKNYTEVLRDIAVGEPVFLTENGTSRYAVLHIAEYEETQAILKLISELAKGANRGREHGYLTLDETQPEFAPSHE